MIKLLGNWIANKEVRTESPQTLEKLSPHNGEKIFDIPISSAAVVDQAVQIASQSFQTWSQTTPVLRGALLFKVRDLMSSRFERLVKCVSIETGKPIQDAEGEVRVAISQCEFFASEGSRLYSRTLTSGMANKYSNTVRVPIGVAGLIVPANTPIANIAWKVFPALICGNSVVLKASEDSPEIANLMAEIFAEAGLPEGVFNVIHGDGVTTGGSLVAHPLVKVISFTGSTAVGKIIALTASQRLARVSLELGGKNPFVVCDDADIDQAVHWASLSAFSNAGQRCAAGSRILVMSKVYDEFLEKLSKKALSLKLGIERGCDLGPVINKKQHRNILNTIQGALREGGRLVVGGQQPESSDLASGYYIQPTLIDSLSNQAELNQKEIFGPVATLQRFETLEQALYLCHDSEYGLTSAIHTKDIDRGMWFAQRIRAGVANINIGTFGSEAHMPFGGFGSSGNGTREPGVEALDVYSELKNISYLIRPQLIG